MISLPSQLLRASFFAFSIASRRAFLSLAVLAILSKKLGVPFLGVRTIFPEGDGVLTTAVDIVAGPVGKDGQAARQWAMAWQWQWQLGS
jgi:hypothetical protein